MWVALASAAACGSVSGAPDATIPDASPDATLPRCNPTAAFGTPVKVSELDTTDSDEGARLSPDELTVYFSSTRPGGVGGWDIYTATRASRTATWGTPSLLAGVNTGGLERRPTVTADGLTLYALVGASPNYALAMATRPSTSASFGALATITSLDSPANDQTPYVLPSGAALYYDSNASGNYLLYRAARNGTGFDTPQVVTGTNLETADQSDVAITPDELTLYFSSNRSGAGTNTIFEATRTSVANGFGDPVALGLDPTGRQLDMASWISSDNCVLYVTTITTAGDYDIYTATRGN
jgi:hypothetical protein